MPLITDVHESLPYIDPEPTPAERAAAEALIAAEQARTGSQPSSSPSAARLPPAYEPTFTPRMRQELERLSLTPRQPLAAIDLSRYEAQDLPAAALLLHQQEQEQEQQQQKQQQQQSPHAATTTTASAAAGAAAHDALAAALARAYASHTYLAARRAQLALLDGHGRNAWLVANYQLEGELGALEHRLAAARRDLDLVTVRRRRAQDEAAAELRALDDTWRRGVGRVLETEVATDALRRQAAAGPPAAAG